ncbi:DUF4192 domain-containing protein [Nocardia higoensis]|uniref:DUF4192 domain-containing protein n=1 Tax=Nocardia higoensis TaxID=228599 RepID=UPI0012F6B913|nr:DUF4192 domain-containing protein [Nocardia higoensis]
MSPAADHPDDRPGGLPDEERLTPPTPWWAESQTGGSAPDPLAGVALPPPVDVTTECAEAAPRFGPADHTRRLRLDEVGELIAALPALVGFFPQRSLVVAVLGPQARLDGVAEILSVVRFDLEPDKDRAAAAAAMYAKCTANVASSSQSRDVLVVMVDDRLITPGGQGATVGFSAERLMSRVVRRFEREGLRIDGAWATPGIAAGMPWWTLLGSPRLDRMPDPSASAVAVANVLEGRPILPSRGELVALLAPDETLREQVAERIGAVAGRARSGFVRALRRGDVLGYRRRSLEFVLTQIAAMESGAILDVEEVAAGIVTLRERAVRDALFGLAVGDHADAAERLWIQLARACTGPDRADPATLVAYSAYVRGDGPFAGIAIEAALHADPTHSLAVLLDTALRAGMRPSHLRRLARSGYDTAACLGVDLGPMTR